MEELKCDSNGFTEEKGNSEVKAADNNVVEISESDNVPETDEETARTSSPVKEESGRSSKILKKRKKGIIYVSNIPKHMNVTRIREILGQYGEIGRVYLQFEKVPESEKRKRKKRRRYARHFTEGWVEFQSKRVAKQVAEMLNSKQISTRKRSKFFDCLWSIKYLPRFKWVHLSERLSYENAVHKQRLMTEVSQAKKEAAFFQSNLDKSEKLNKSKKVKNKSV